MMSRRRWVHAAIAAALVPPLLVIGSASPSQAQQSTGKFKLVESLKPTGQVTAAKTPTSRLATTDQSLLNRTDSAMVSIAVKLDYDSTSTYEGTVAGYAATSPAVTGKALSGSPAEQRYEGRISNLENKFLAELTKRVPNAKTGQRLRTVYGGIALQVPANKINQIVNIPGVVAVQTDKVAKPQTDSSPEFIGATALYPQLGGKANAGKGVIFGVLDTGAWPEHPSFADNGNLGAPPAKADGTPRTCDFGDNPLTPATDVFHCNNKLIGGAPFLKTYVEAGNPPEVYTTARDSNGHGTHTGSTTAGDPVASAKVFGVERGPINGIAPGAWISVYKVCGLNGCYATDSAAAVQQAIKDGVNVINFSIGGGSTPFSDPAELAFLDAYAAGVFVSASAGNSGPGAATTDHLAPWVTTVAASTQRREFDSTLTVTSSDGASATFVGSSITSGVGPAPVVFASAAPYSDNICSHEAPAGTFTGKIVVCQRGGSVNGVAIGRVQKGFNVSKGGAVGMILYNPTLADTETDNHFLPVVHLADGTQFLAFTAAHPNGLTAKFTDGIKANGRADVMAAFSSRGPGAQFLKPDITAPGVQILAGNTPTPDEIPGGPPGQYFQAIAGTSMSSPHIAGSAVLMKALHPTWTPGQIKSALLTTATTSVLKEDQKTPADPFDMGSGRVQVNLAGNPGLTFDETAARMFALGNDPVNAVQLNLPSVNAPVMPGKLTVVRTAKNVTDQTQTYRVQTTAPSGASITVSPSQFTVAPGATAKLEITIKSGASPGGQYFGQVRLVPTRTSVPTLHLPVAFVTSQGDVSLTQSCDKSEVHLIESTTCTITAHNKTFADTTADLTTTTTFNLPIVGANGATVNNPFRATKTGATLAGAVPGTPSIAPGTIAGYLPLDSFPGTLVAPIGDEQFLKFNVPPFMYNGIQYSGISIDSNGYIVPGLDATAKDNNCCPATGIPDPNRPNNVLAPFWTDLDGSGAPGILVNVISDGTNEWTVVEWRVNVFGTTSQRVFQVWLGDGATQDIVFAYKFDTIAAPPGLTFRVGAENIIGTGGQGLPPGVLPTTDLRVTSTAPVPGGTTTYTVTGLGIFPGNGKVTTSMNSPAVPGTTIVSSTVTVAGTFNHPHRFN